MSERTSFKQGEFCWVDLVAHDMKAAIEYYKAVFGWEADVQDTHGGPPYAMFKRKAENVGGIGQMSEEMKAQGIPPMWNSYINVNDIDAIVARATELGATVTVPVMQVMDAGKLAFIMDNVGASVAFWQPGQHCGASLVNEVGCFCWNELATREPEKSRQFYSDLLGWNFDVNENSPSPYWMIKNDGRQNGGVIQMTEGWGEAPPHWAVYFTVADIDAFIDKHKSLGGTAHCEPFEMQVGRMAVVADPQGASFSVIQMSVEPD